MINHQSIITCGWIDLEEVSEVLSHEEWYGFPIDDLSTGRTFVIDNPHFAPLFSNPLDANEVEVLPTYYRDNLGEFMFAPGLVHWLYGPSETGKSFLALGACLENSGIYLSLEMGRSQMATRIRKMAYHYLDSSRFIFPEIYQNIRAALRELIHVPRTVIVVDSFAELALLDSADTNNDQDVGRLIHEYIKPLARAGHCVIVIDHIAKNPSNHEYPLGTQNKKSQSDVCLFIDRQKETGIPEILVTKDRYWIYKDRFSDSNRRYGSLTLSENPLRANVQRSGHESYQVTSATRPRERVVLDQIVKLLEFGPLPKSHLSSKLSVSQKSFDRCLRQLIDGDWVLVQVGRNDAGFKCQMVSLTGKQWVTASRL